MSKKDPVLPWQAFALMLLLAVGLAVDFRFPFLGLRPMHTDEAILGMKTIEFWKTGLFAYDPADYHGPALHWLTKATGLLGGWSPETITETKLRLVPALCGTLLVLSTLLLGGALGRLGTVVAMLLMAVSPLQVFFSRYYIMEMPLVLFTMAFLCACWLYARSNNAVWLVLGGIALGLQHATKETFVINMAAAGCGWIAARVINGGFAPRPTNRLSLSMPRKGVRRPWLWVAVPAVIVSVVIFSSVFRDWTDVKESLTTYGLYITRAEGSGHEKPWHYYLTLLTYRNMGVTWSEGLIMALALVGIGNAFLGTHRDGPRQSLLIFLSVYAVALLGGYSVLSYKTPWCALSAQHAFTLLAGVGASTIWFSIHRSLYGRIIAASVFGLGIWHLSHQTHEAIHNLRSSEERNPYVYSHTTSTLLTLVDAVEKLEKMSPDGLPLVVISAPPDAGWPLPWYFRGKKDVTFAAAVPETLDAPVIIADVTLQKEVEARLGDRAYNNSTMSSLRPGSVLMMFVEAKLWERHIGYLTPQLQKP